MQASQCGVLKLHKQPAVIMKEKIFSDLHQNKVRGRAVGIKKMEYKEAAWRSAIKITFLQTIPFRWNPFSSLDFGSVFSWFSALCTSSPRTANLCTTATIFSRRTYWKAVQNDVHGVLVIKTTKTCPLHYCAASLFLRFLTSWTRIRQTANQPHDQPRDASAKTACRSDVIMISVAFCFFSSIYSKPVIWVHCQKKVTIQNKQ